MATYQFVTYIIPKNELATVVTGIPFVTNADFCKVI